MTVIRIGSFEIGLRIRDNDLVEVIGPGRARVPFTRRSRESIEVVSTLTARFEHERLEALVRDQALRARLRIVDLTQTQRAIVWVNGRLDAILGPGLFAYWSAPAGVEVELFDVRQRRLTHDRLDAILAGADAGKFLRGLDVSPHEDVLVFANGELIETLRAGRHVFWNSGRLEFRAVDRRERVADVSGQEIMTSDKVTLRVNLIVAWQVTDTVRSVAVVDDAAQALYREAQLALRAAVGSRTLDALLTDKQAAGAEVREAIRARAAEFGVEVKSVGLRDIILPGDMKAILNRVIEAEKSAQAELIRRREETAAARSQANTAKILDDSPTLARLRELELLGQILAGSNATFVLGQGDLAAQIRGLVN
ncbi:MAG: slipin family protein [Phycisphaeraceae bacterium]|nr:slipin family protein [Phycisphaeraceae bacterium]